MASNAWFAVTITPCGVHRHDALRGGLEQRPQRAIVFLVAPRLPRLLRPLVLVEVEIEPGEPRDVAVGVTVGASPALDPRHRSVGPHDPERVLPRILRFRRQDLVEQGEHPRTVVVVHARHPRVGRRGFVGREPVERTESFVPVDLIGRGNPRPGAAGRRFERDAEPLFLLAQRRFGAGALHRVPGPFADVANQFDLRRRPDARRDVIGAEGRDHPSAFEQRRPDERGDLPRQHLRPVAVAQAGIRLDIVDHDGLAAPERLAQLLAQR